MNTWQDDAARARASAAQAAQMPKESSGTGPKALLTISILAWAGMYCAAVLMLPPRVPIHWSGSDADGVSRADSWTTKGGALAFLAIVFAIILALVLLSRLALAAPDAINTRNKTWWLETGERLIRYERLLREDLMMIIGLTILLLTAVGVQIIAASKVPDGGHPWWVFWVMLGIYLAGVGAVIIRMNLTGRYSPDSTLE